MRIINLSVAVMMAAAAAGCATKTYKHHPSVYETRGRPDWTYDENRIKEDLEQAKQEHLCEELVIPDAYYFFLGVQSTFCPTEELAREGAILDANASFADFLKSRGTIYIEKRLKDKLDESNVSDFETKLHTAAVAEIKHLKPVRWYLQEQRTSVFKLRSIFTSARWYRPEWRAWCLVAYPRERAEQIYTILFEQAEVENLDNYSPTRSQDPARYKPKPEEK